MNTMGIVLVAFLAKKAPPAGEVTRTSTFRRTSSAASAESRSTRPAAYRSSMMTLAPSTYPSVRSPSRKAACQRLYGSMSELSERKPIRQTFPVGGAPEANDTTTRRRAVTMVAMRGLHGISSRSVATEVAMSGIPTR